MDAAGAPSASVPPWAAARHSAQPEQRLYSSEGLRAPPADASAAVPASLARSDQDSLAPANSLAERQTAAAPKWGARRFARSARFADSQPALAARYCAHRRSHTSASADRTQSSAPYFPAAQFVQTKASAALRAWPRPAPSMRARSFQSRAPNESLHPSHRCRRRIHPGRPGGSFLETFLQAPRPCGCPRSAIRPRPD